MWPGEKVKLEMALNRLSSSFLVCSGKEIRYRGGLVMREEYHSALGRTAKNACIEPCSLCLATLLFIPMPSLTSTSLPPKISLHLNKCFASHSSVQIISYTRYTNVFGELDFPIVTSLIHV